MNNPSNKATKNITANVPYKNKPIKNLKTDLINLNTSLKRNIKETNL